VINHVGSGQPVGVIRPLGFAMRPPHWRNERVFLAFGAGHFRSSRDLVWCLAWRPDPGSSRFGTEVSLGRVAQRHRKGLGLVECLVVFETVVELAEELVEQIAGGGGDRVRIGPRPTSQVLTSPVSLRSPTLDDPGNYPEVNPI